MAHAAFDFLCLDDAIVAFLNNTHKAHDKFLQNFVYSIIYNDKNIHKSKELIIDVLITF